MHHLPLAVVLLASLALAGPPKKKKVPAPPPKSAANLATEAGIKATLDGAQQKVGGCVLDNGPPGNWTIVVKAKIALNSAGQLMGTTLTMVPDGPTSEPTRKCIDAVLQTLTWPKAAGPMVNAEREWTFSTQTP